MFWKNTCYELQLYIKTRQIIMWWKYVVYTVDESLSQDVYFKAKYLQSISSREIRSNIKL